MGLANVLGLLDYYFIPLACLVLLPGEHLKCIMSCVRLYQVDLDLTAVTAYCDLTLPLLLALFKRNTVGKEWICPR